MATAYNRVRRGQRLPRLLDPATPGRLSCSYLLLALFPWMPNTAQWPTMAQALDEPARWRRIGAHRRGDPGPPDG